MPAAIKWALQAARHNNPGVCVTDHMVLRGYERRLPTIALLERCCASCSSCADKAQQKLDVSPFVFLSQFHFHAPCQCTSLVQAFAVAAHAARAGEHGARALPALASDARPASPGLESVPLPRVPGLDLANGAAGGVAGWEAVRLLAPRAELRLLVSGRATLDDAQRLGCAF